MADTPDHTIADAPAAPPEDYAGRVLGDFELIRRIGVGGMGQVYLARQKSLKRQVAIKILKGELAANQTALQRFRAEAEAVANLTHAHIVQVYAIDEAQGLHYMALEYVDGRNLRDFLEKKGIPDLPLALEIMRQVASALERAGELGFVHRDIKPENILLSKRAEVKVTDFGLSRCFAADAPLNLTQSGVTMGTPLYMSPEQVRGQPVDPRSDIYSFGVTCYHMLAGEAPFRAATAFDIALLHVQGTPRPLGDLRPDLPRELCSIIHKMMAKRPEDRYQSAREILTDLARFKDGLGPAAALPLTATAFAPALGNSSTNVPTVGPTQVLAQPVPPGGSWRYAAVAGLALAAAGGGAAVHWARTPTSAAINPDDALADLDPAPSVLREKELKRHIADDGRQPDRVVNDLLDLTELYVEERRLEEALKLFDPVALQKLGALRTGKEGPQLAILSGLGRGVVLAHQDRPEESIAEFQKVVGKYPPKAKLPNPGRLEAFFNRPIAGLHWRRAVGEALDRDEKNLGGKVPDELRRLRLLPAKGPAAGRKGE
jgi:eukaryotic-like serine/threonine-protein kinase